VGTTFRLYLPCALEAGAIEVEQAPARTEGAGETVLVVEDSLPLRRVATRQLRALGYVVSEANDAPMPSRSWRRAGGCSVHDVVIQRRMMVSSRGCATRRWPDIKVVLTSGFPADPACRWPASAKVHLLTKPYRTADLARTLSEALDVSLGDVVDS